MSFIAVLIYETTQGLPWDEADEMVKQQYLKTAIHIINAAEPVWRSRTSGDRDATVGTLQSLARMATVRGIPMLKEAESEMDRELVVRNWINECTERYSKLGRV
jgi:hypothetical protein